MVWSGPPTIGSPFSVRKPAAAGQFLSTQTMIIVLHQPGTVMAMPAPARPKYRGWIDGDPNPAGRTFSTSRIQHRPAPRLRGSSLASASIERPRGSPRMVHGANLHPTAVPDPFDLARSPGSIHTRSSSPSRTTHTGVGTGAPVLRKVVSSTYSALPSTSNGVVTPSERYVAGGAAATRAARTGQQYRVSRCRGWSWRPASGTRHCCGSCAAGRAPVPAPAGCPARTAPGGV